MLRFVMHTSLICELRKILIDGKLEQKAKVQREGKPLGWSEIIPLSMKELFRGRQAWDRQTIQDERNNQALQKLADKKCD